MEKMGEKMKNKFMKIVAPAIIAVGLTDCAQETNNQEIVILT